VQAAVALEAEVQAAVALYAAHAASSAPKLLRFGALRAVLAPVVERFLLLDRLLYVREVRGRVVAVVVVVVVVVVVDVVVVVVVALGERRQLVAA